MLSRTIHVLDYTLAVASIAYGFYSQSGLWLVGGLLGLALARANPGARIKEVLQRRMLRKSHTEARRPWVSFPPPPSAPYSSRRRSPAPFSGQAGINQPTGQ